MSKARIAIPIPTSTDPAYNQRCWQQYATAIANAGGDPVEIPLALPPDETARLASTCQAILLPGSPADVNPQKYGQAVDPATSPADLPRANVDEILLQDAHNLHKPILGICYGTQSLNVWRGGTLIQDLTVLPVNHRAGAGVAVAHTAAIDLQSFLAPLVPQQEATLQEGFLRLPINSSHHQAIGILGDGLRVIARCPHDGVVEAVEGGQSPDHFVLGLQWHPERSAAISPASRAIFARLVEEAKKWVPRPIHTSIG